MDSSNAPAATPAPSTEASAPAKPAEPAKQVTPVNNGVVPGGKPGSSKGLIIGLCIGGFLIILITVLCIIFIPMLFGVDWEETHAAAEQFDSTSRKVDTECGNVSSYLTSTYTSDSEYEGYVKKCKNSINSYFEAVDALKDASGVKKNKEIKQKYEDFMAIYEKVKPAYETLPDTCKELHKFYAIVNDIDSDDLGDMSDEAIDGMFKDLINSENESVRNIGNKLSGEVKNYIKTYKAYLTAREAWYDISYSDPNYDNVYSAYQEARDAYYDAEIDTDIDMEEIFGFSEDELDDFNQKSDDLYNTMTNLYYQNR